MHSIIIPLSLSILLFSYQTVISASLEFQVILEASADEDGLTPDSYVLYACNSLIDKDSNDNVVCSGHMQTYTTPSDVLVFDGLYNIPDNTESTELVAVNPVSVTASGVSSSTYPPANTLDNDLSTRWSSQQGPAWIAYDLGGEVSLWSLDIAWLDGNKRSANFDVQGSLDGTTWFELLPPRKSSGTTSGFERYTLPELKTSHIRINGNGNTVNNYTSIIEVNFYEKTFTQQSNIYFRATAIKSVEKNGETEILESDLSNQIIIDYASEQNRPISPTLLDITIKKIIP